MADNGQIIHAFLSCKAQLARLASQIVPPHEIEDIVQETYVRVCQLTEREIVERPRALMMSVARNLALDHVKRAEYRLTSQFAEEAEVSSVSTLAARRVADESFHAVASNEEFARFCDAVRCLPLQCRRVFVLKKVYGYSQREIATELKLSESTVEKHIAKGMARCMERMLKQTSPKNGRDEGTRQAASSQGGQS